MKARLVSLRCFVLKVNSRFVVALFCFISLCLRVPVFLNATRRERNLPPPLREKSGSMQFVETEKKSSQSPQELKFVCYVSGGKVSEKSFKWQAYVESGGVPT